MSQVRLRTCSQRPRLHRLISRELGAVWTGPYYYSIVTDGSLYIVNSFWGPMSLDDGTYSSFAILHWIWFGAGCFLKLVATETVLDASPDQETSAQSSLQQAWLRCPPMMWWHLDNHPASLASWNYAMLYLFAGNLILYHRMPKLVGLTLAYIDTFTW